MFVPFIPGFFFGTRRFFAALLRVTQEKITLCRRKRPDEGVVFSYEDGAKSLSFLNQSELYNLPRPCCSIRARHAQRKDADQRQAGLLTPHSRRFPHRPRGWCKPQSRRSTGCRPHLPPGNWERNQKMQTCRSMHTARTHSYRCSFPPVLSCRQRELQWLLQIIPRLQPNPDNIAHVDQQ